MSTTITRLYSSDKIATDAANKLKRVGFRGEEVNLVTGPGTATSLVAAIMRGGVPASHARIYAQRIGQGASLVTVNARAFTATAAVKILDGFDPIDSGVADQDIYTEAEASDIPPLLFGEPRTVLLDSNTYFSSLFGLPLVTHGEKKVTNLLTDAKPFSGLMHGTTSSWLGLPTIIHD